MPLDSKINEKQAAGNTEHRGSTSNVKVSKMATNLASEDQAEAREDAQMKEKSWQDSQIDWEPEYGALMQDAPTAEEFRERGILVGNIV